MNVLKVMNRRQFVNLSASSIGLVSIAPSWAWARSAPQKPAWLLDWIRINDQQLANYRPLKVTDTSSPYAGGYMNDAEMPNPHTTSGFLMKGSMLYATPESTHFTSADLLRELTEAASALVKMQHSDGTIDLLDTNFHSTPDTAFVLENVVPAYKFLKPMSGTAKAVQAIERFIRQAGEALTVGGIHTPNHRWVVGAALTKVHELFPDPKYLKRIDQWLAEHIDLDPDGQYTEKSTNTYSPIVNRSLIIMARGLNKPELLEPVRRNLMMTMYFVHPNGEVVTEASNRQDKGTIANTVRYYYCYRFMALQDKNGEMAAMCRLIEATCPKDQLAGYLDYFLEDPSLWRELPASKPLPVNYARAFPYSGLVRIRRGAWDCTLLSNNTTFLTFHKGNAVLQGLRFATSFFGKGQFQSEKVEQTPNGWTLRQSLTGPYYQPLPPDKIDPNGDLDKAPRSLRQQSEIQKLESVVQVSETGSGIEVTVTISGTEGVPVTLELIFRPGGSFSGVTKYTKRENTWLLSGQEGTYTVGTDVLRFGTGKVLHKGILLRGALPPMDAPAVYITGYTPFTHRIQFS